MGLDDRDSLRVLQAALDDWAHAAPRLAEIAEGLETGAQPSQRFHEHDAMSPLPRAYQWADGSAYVNHVELVRKARGAELPDSFWTDPLMYQGGSDTFIGPRDPIRFPAEAVPAWGIDFEAEVAVVVDDCPMGISPEAAREKIRRLAADYGLEVDPDRMITELSVGERQRVEILKALYRRYNANGLSPAEASTIERRIEKLRHRLRNERHDRDHHRG